jgi:hypothetical protein
MTNDTNDNDPLSDFSVPQDADIVADDPAGGEIVADDTGEHADKVAEDPSVKADTPAEAEELTAEPGA